MTRTIKVHFDGQVFVPDEPVDLPKGESAEVTVSVNGAEVPSPNPPDEEHPLRSLVEWASALPPLPDSPGDAAAQHDHYLYGSPKRDNP
jgi:hypothetical protein